MSQNFKLKFDEMQESNPSAHSEENTSYQTYDTESHIRNICFEWPDGKLKFLNYAYLVSGEYDPENQLIRLIFTSDIIVISGTNLKGLFGDISGQILKSLSYTHTRYKSLINNDIIISEITHSTVG